ncbi:MAG: 1-acyl-sn-glycerol-3-phosphate acyltransferase [Deltaproteobacteria bacterium]|nr:1-acyl-sn-glycerol-3-phosphate acyltransferase [Deltaproteobacteria bacterium]
MIVRTLLVWVVGVPVVIIIFLCILLSFPFDRSGNTTHWFGRQWMRLLLALSNVKVEVVGADNLPDGAVVMASNHQSAFDILALHAYLPIQFRWLAKKSLFKIPVVGWVMTIAGYISIDRARASLAYKSIERAAEKIKREGVSVVIFPEGTRGTTGELLPFKRGSFILAIKSGVPVIPVSIQGTLNILKKGSLLIRPANVKVVIGASVDSTGVKEEELTKMVRAAVEKGLSC